MISLIVVCLSAFMVLLWLLRKNRISLGLPIAYLYSLLLIHVPGAVANVIGRDFLLHADLIRIAMRFTAVGAVCFVAGVWFSRPAISSKPNREYVDRTSFCRFCLIGGWIFIYGLTPLYDIPSVAAALDKGASIWMLGVILGLRKAVQGGDRKGIVLWTLAMMAFPVFILLLGGFLSYGSAAIILVCAVLTISTQSYMRVVVGIAVFVFVSLSIFVNYYHHRNEIRRQVWGGAPLEARVGSVLDTARDFEWLDLTNRDHLKALDERLNQNYFVGLADRRIAQGQAKYLEGESIWEGLIALVPRVLWSEKPVYGGSPQIVSKMTGLRFSRNTSVGVGNIMEFQVNFGIPGVAIGLFILGWLIGRLDYRAAVAEERGELISLIFYFLPCVALIQPAGSIVELTGGAAAAVVGAYVWKWLWTTWSGRWTAGVKKSLITKPSMLKP